MLMMPCVFRASVANGNQRPWQLCVHLRICHLGASVEEPATVRVLTAQRVVNRQLIFSNNFQEGLWTPEGSAANR
jgi:hypothetical protein